MSVFRDPDQEMLTSRAVPFSIRPTQPADSAGYRVQEAVAAVSRDDNETAKNLLATLTDGSDDGLSDNLEIYVSQIATGESVSPDVRAEAWETIARSCDLRGNPQAAKDALEHAYTLMPDPARLSRLALRISREGSLNEAWDLLMGGLTQWPENVGLYAQAANLALDTDAIDEARKLLDHAQLLEPANPALLSVIARLAITEDRADAIEIARNVVPGDPSLGRGLLSIALSRAGRLDEDPGLAEAVLADLPSDIWILNQFGLVLLERGRSTDAILVLDHALRLSPGDLQALRTRGLALATHGEYAAAAADLDRAALANDDPWLTSTRGEIARVRGDLPTAIELLGSLSADEAPSWVSVSLGSALSAAGSFSRAREVLQSALDHDPDDIDALCTLGEIAFRDDEPSVEEAEAMFRHALVIDQQRPRAHSLLGEALRRKGRLHDAIVEFDHAISLSPSYSYAIASKGQALVALHDVDRGADLLMQAARQSPSTPWILDELVSALEAHRPDTAESVLRGLQRDVREAGGDIVPLCSRRAQLAERQGRLAEAERLYSLARRSAPDDRDLAVAHVGALRALGRNEEALNVLDELSSPDDRDLRWTKVELLWDLDRLNDVHTELEELNRLESPPAYVAAALGEIYRVEGQRDGARQLLTYALEKEPDNVYCLSSLGVLEIEAGHSDLGRTYLRRSLEIDPRHRFALSHLMALELDTGHEREVRELLHTVEDDDEAEAVYLRAETLYGLGEYAHARQIIDDYLVESGNQDPAALRLRGWAEVALGKSRKAARSFSAAAQMEEPPSQIIFAVSSLIRVGLWSDASAVVQHALERKNQYADTAMAMLWEGAGAWEVAARHGVEGRDRLPQSQFAVYMASRSLRHAGRLPEARDTATEALNLGPRYLPSIANLAECLHLNEEYEAAKSLFDQILSRLTERVHLEADDMNLQGWCLLRLGRLAEAVEVFVQALSVTDQSASVLFNLLLASLLNGDLRQVAVLENRAREELQTLAPLSRRGVLATVINDMSTVEGLLEAEESITIARRLTAEYRNVVQALDSEIAKLASELSTITGNRTRLPSEFAPPSDDIL